MNPIPSFFDNIKNNRLMCIVWQYLIYFLIDLIDVVSGDASNGLNLIFQWSIGIVVRIFEH
jgi:hypothetical protein